MNGAELAHEFFDATQAGDRAALERICSKDAVVWHNYDQMDMPFGVIAAGLAKLASVLEGFAYSHRRYNSVPDGAVLQHSLTGTLPSGQRLDIPMMVQMYVRDGRICRFEEYLNQADIAVLATAVAQS
jgi:ketosteroid isomerase-like protein